MGKKLSFNKINKMIAMLSEGHTEIYISNQLKVDQSTVSKYKSEFKAIADQKGKKAALSMYQVKDNVQEIETVVSEFTKSNLSIADVNVALRVDGTLQQAGIERKDYHNFIDLVQKTKISKYYEAAAKLNNLEKDSGMNYQQIVSNADKKLKELLSATHHYAEILGKIKNAEEKLNDINKQIGNAKAEFEAQMQAIGVDEKRLSLIEPLAMVLKDAGIPDKDLPGYIKIQEAFKKASIGVAFFGEILELVKVETAFDGGENFLTLLTKHKGLDGAVDAKQLELQNVEKTLKEKTDEQVNLENDINGLKEHKKALESEVAPLAKEKWKLDNVRNLFTISNQLYQQLLQNKAILEKEIPEREKYLKGLNEDIEIKEPKARKLSELAVKHDALAAEIEEMEVKKSKEKERWQVFEGFLGLVNASSLEDLQKNAVLLPIIVKEAKEGQYSPDFLKNAILHDLVGPILTVFRCSECNVRFVVDKPVKSGDYVCPIGGPLGSTHNVIIDEDASALLNKLLRKPEPGSKQIGVGSVKVFGKQEEKGKGQN